MEIFVLSAQKLGGKVVTPKIVLLMCQYHLNQIGFVSQLVLNLAAFYDTSFSTFFFLYLKIHCAKNYCLTRSHSLFVTVFGEFVRRRIFLLTEKRSRMILFTNNCFFFLVCGSLSVPYVWWCHYNLYMKKKNKTRFYKDVFSLANLSNCFS